MEATVLNDSEQHMAKSIEVLRRELSTLRTGRANPAIIEHLTVDYYGAPTPLMQLAAITSPEPRQLLVQPYDRGATGNIEKAIRNSDLGFNPTNEGTIIRITIPQLTEERRRDLVKVVHKRVEEAKVSIRNVRRDALEHLKKQRKEKEISEDDEKRLQEQIQKLTDRFIRDADATGQAKESELLEA